MSKAAIKEKTPIASGPAATAASEKAPIKRKGISLRPRALPVPEAPRTEPAADATGVIVPVCVHRWVIESPNGETSHGRCRNCGAEKEFPNAAEDGLWERNVPQSRWTGRSDWTPKSDAGY